MGLLQGCKDNNPGPEVTGCVVDNADHGFQCVTYPKTDSFRSFADGVDLECVSPENIEEELKACNNHQILPVDICKLNPDLSEFDCVTPQNVNYQVPDLKAENYYCMSDQDEKRVSERCKD